MYIYIDIRNNPAILEAIRNLLISEINSGWKCDTNTKQNNEFWSKYLNHTASYFHFNIEEKRFSWITEDGDTNFEPEKFQPVNTVEEAIDIARFAIDNAELFKIDPNVKSDTEFDTESVTESDTSRQEIPEYKSKMFPDHIVQKLIHIFNKKIADIDEAKSKYDPINSTDVLYNKEKKKIEKSKYITRQKDTKQVVEQWAGVYNKAAEFNKNDGYHNNNDYFFDCYYNDTLYKKCVIR